MSSDQDVRSASSSDNGGSKWRRPFRSPEPQVAAAAPVSDMDLLRADPFDDDLGAELRTRVPRRLSRTTLALGGTVLVVAGFLGGVIVQKNYGVTTSNRGNSGAGAFANAAAGGGGAGGFGGRTGTGQSGGQGGQIGGQGSNTAAGPVTTGTVKLVDGTTVYLTTANGDVVTVKTTGTTAVKVEQAGAIKDIPVGATVSVQGTADSDGIVTATTVTTQK